MTAGALDAGLKSGATYRRVLASAFVALLTAPLAAQTIAVSTTGGMLRVRTGFEFIEGEVLNRLRDGRSLRLDFELSVLAEPRGAVVAAARRSFNVSFDLWEERIAVTRIGIPARSVSHLRPRDAEAWCLENLTLASTELGRLTRDTPFWIRLAYTAPDEVPATDSGESETYTLRRLIDVLSRRPRDGELGKSVEAGPFRLPD